MTMGEQPSSFSSPQPQRAPPAPPPLLSGSGHHLLGGTSLGSGHDPHHHLLAEVLRPGSTTPLRRKGVGHTSDPSLATWMANHALQSGLHHERQQRAGHAQRAQQLEGQLDRERVARAQDADQAVAAEGRQARELEEAHEQRRAAERERDQLRHEKTLLEGQLREYTAAAAAAVTQMTADGGGASSGSGGGRHAQVQHEEACDEALASLLRAFRAQRRRWEREREQLRREAAAQAELAAAREGELARAAGRQVR
jgi:hypothetical protein